MSRELLTRKRLHGEERFVAWQPSIVHIGVPSASAGPRCNHWLPVPPRHALRQMHACGLFGTFHAPGGATQYKGAVTRTRVPYDARLMDLLCQMDSHTDGQATWGSSEACVVFLCVYSSSSYRKLRGPKVKGIPSLGASRKVTMRYNAVSLRLGLRCTSGD